MTDKELVELLRKMLPPKVLYGDLIGAEGVYAHSGPFVWEDMESYVISEAADRIEQLRAELTNEIIDNTNLIGELATVAAERDRYKAERDAAEHKNLKPLTLEELRGMDGEPIWIQGKSRETSGWAVMRYPFDYQVARCPDEWNLRFKTDECGKTWLAYRSKPKEEQ